MRLAVAGTDGHIGGWHRPPAGSRRRRLWELNGSVHCPLVGVCLPITVSRRVIDKAVGGQILGDDHEMHCAAIVECKRRSVIAEVVQKQLDRRYAVALRQAARAKTTDALAAWWWPEASAGTDLAGALWAVLTHARCDSILEHRVLGEVHMQQHQVGMAARVDLGRVDALEHENAALARELAAAQRRCTCQAAEQARQADQRQTELVRLRADLLIRDTSLAPLREQLASLEETAPGRNTRFELARQARAQREQIQTLQRALLQAQQEVERQRRRAGESHGHRAGLPSSHRAHRRALHAPRRWRRGQQRQARLDVGGGRPGHLCQTGCISHDAYWRVKDHCKRTGKRCVFVDTPSRAGLEPGVRSDRLAPRRTVRCRPKT